MVAGRAPGALRPLVLLLACLHAMHPAATQGLGDLSFAVCDSSDPRQQWCVTGTGAIKDRWGRCLTRHDCGNPSSPEKVIVDSCTMGACAGSQSWHFDEDEKQIKSILGNACLDISVFENSAQTYGCKKNDKSKGPGYCGDANQQWDLRDDGTLAVPTQPKALCKALTNFEWADCSDPSKPGVKSNPCGPACLVTAPPPPSTAGKPAPEFAGSGKTCINTSGGLGWEVVVMLLGPMACYLALGVGLNWRIHGRPASRADFWLLLPHRAHWGHLHSLVRDGLAFSRFVVTSGRIPHDRGRNAGTVKPSGEGGREQLLGDDRVGGAERRDTKKKSGREGKQKKSTGKKHSKERLSRGAREAPAPASTMDTVGGGACVVGAGDGGVRVTETKEKGALHESQAKITVRGINTI